MELKARPAKYEDASQLAKYYDVFKQQRKSDILMWLVATAVPQSVREFLDRIGIEYTEIHESEYKVVALRQGEITEEVNLPLLTMTENFSLQKSESILHVNRLTRNSNSYKSKISGKYRVSLDRFSNIFPAAYEFLKTVTNSNEGFWLSTATNAHLYFKDSFLSYIKMQPEGILFSPYYNGQIEGTTKDNHKLIFHEVFHKLTKLNDGSKALWAYFANDGTVIIKKQAPSEFFSKFIDEIKKVHLVQ